MSRTVIRVDALGKCYRIGEGTRHTNLRHVIGDVLRAPVQLLTGSKAGSSDALNDNFNNSSGHDSGRSSRFIWALKDVGFEIRQGEVVGLIGRNGAGKSTLLKILARITRPTEGYAEVHGRVGSLLEVGTGFHGELTGRENVYMSGVILGMRKAEIDRKFDEIVAFSEVERFLDTPLKHYSSGMQMRLAFAVAAHLEPEILFVDEVLAVGDVAFQKKCLGKMSEVARHGRTILFVSHNMAAINALTSRAILLECSRLEFDGATSEATARYYAESLAIEENSSDLRSRSREGTGKARFSLLTLQPLGANGDPVEAAYPGCDLRIEFEIECRTPIMESIAAVIIYDQSGFRVIDTNTAQKGKYVSLGFGEKAKVSLLLYELLLRPGRYFVGLWLGRHGIETTDHVERAASLTIIGVKDESEHPIVYPGVYLCRFDESVSIISSSSINTTVNA